MARFRRPSFLAWLLLASGLLLFVSAGRWQHGKALMKEGEQIAWAASAEQAPRPVSGTDIDRRGGYDRVRAHGHWLPQRYLLDNQVRDAHAGVEVYAPLRLGDGRLLLVSLGWLPYSGPRREPPPLPELPSGPVEVSGMLTPPTAHGLRLGRGWADVATYPKLIPYFELEEIAADVGGNLGARVLRAQPPAGSPLRQTWHPLMSMPPERHRAYAWQWWSLAIAIVIVFLVVHRRPRNRSGQP